MHLFIFLSVMDLVSILRRRDDFKVKWIAQIVQFVLCIFLQLEKKEVLRQRNNFLSTFLLV